MRLIKCDEKISIIKLIIKNVKNMSVILKRIPKKSIFVVDNVCCHNLA